MIKRIKNGCGMYTEAFRQCWIPGALFFIVLNFTAFLLPIYRMIQAREYQYTDADVFEIYNAWDSNALALLIIPAAVPMTLIVFRFFEFPRIVRFLPRTAAQACDALLQLHRRGADVGSHFAGHQRPAFHGNVAVHTER